MKWENDFMDIFSEIPLELPPFRGMNHKINLMDPDKQIYCHFLKCSDHYKINLSEKIK